MSRRCNPALTQTLCGANIPGVGGDKPVSASLGVAGASQGCSGTGCWALGAFLGEKGRENAAVTGELQVEMSLAPNFSLAFFDFSSSAGI